MTSLTRLTSAIFVTCFCQRAIAAPEGLTAHMAVDSQAQLATVKQHAYQQQQPNHRVMMRRDGSGGPEDSSTPAPSEESSTPAPKPDQDADKSTTTAPATTSSEELEGKGSSTPAPEQGEESSTPAKKAAHRRQNKAKKAAHKGSSTPGEESSTPAPEQDQGADKPTTSAPATTSAESTHEPKADEAAAHKETDGTWKFCDFGEVQSPYGARCPLLVAQDKRCTPKAEGTENPLGVVKTLVECTRLAAAQNVTFFVYGKGSNKELCEHEDTDGHGECVGEACCVPGKYRHGEWDLFKLYKF